VARLNDDDIGDLSHLITVSDLPTYIAGRTWISRTGIVKGIEIDRRLHPVRREHTIIHELCHAKFTRGVNSEISGVHNVVEDGWVQYHWWPEDKFALALENMRLEHADWSPNRTWARQNVGFRFAVTLAALEERGFDVTAERAWMEKEFTEQERQEQADFVSAVVANDRTRAIALTEKHYEPFKTQAMFDVVRMLGRFFEERGRTMPGGVFGR
jgi:hypothetical protein